MILDQLISYSLYQSSMPYAKDILEVLNKLDLQSLDEVHRSIVGDFASEHKRCSKWQYFSSRLFG